jgi:hypothetical protein
MLPYLGSDFVANLDVRTCYTDFAWPKPYYRSVTAMCGPYCRDLLFTALISQPQNPQRIEKTGWVGTWYPVKRAGVTEVF